MLQVFGSVCISSPPRIRFCVVGRRLLDTIAGIAERISSDRWSSPLFTDLVSIDVFALTEEGKGHRLAAYMSYMCQLGFWPFPPARTEMRHYNLPHRDSGTGMSISTNPVQTAIKSKAWYIDPLCSTRASWWVISTMLARIRARAKRIGRTATSVQVAPRLRRASLTVILPIQKQKVEIVWRTCSLLFLFVLIKYRVFWEAKQFQLYHRMNLTSPAHVSGAERTSKKKYAEQRKKRNTACKCSEDRCFGTAGQCMSLQQKEKQNTT